MPLFLPSYIRVFLIIYSLTISYLYKMSFDHICSDTAQHLLLDGPLPNSQLNDALLFLFLLCILKSTTESKNSDPQMCMGVKLSTEEYST